MASIVKPRKTAQNSNRDSKANKTAAIKRATRTHSEMITVTIKWRKARNNETFARVVYRAVGDKSFACSAIALSRRTESSLCYIFCTFCAPQHCSRCVFIAPGASCTFIVCNNIGVLLSVLSITNCCCALMDLLLGRAIRGVEKIYNISSESSLSIQT